ncbi:hypothetical protein [Streptomyces sp. YKOK-I1]
MAPDPAVSSGKPTYEALALLPLPESLSAPQREGYVCVWGGEALSTSMAVDLGSRMVGDTRVFPRACRTCVGRAAMSALFDHASGPDACPECKSTPDCDTGRALNRLIRGYLR